MNKILVIPDAHVKPGVKNDRFRWLGKFILDNRPDKIVCLGDFGDLSSLSSYDIGKRCFEGRRYKDDVKAVIVAQEVLFSSIRAYNEEARRLHEKTYKPNLYMLLGNHENRINRANNNDSKLEGTIGVEDLKYKEFGWKVSGYLDVVHIDGIAFSHYFTSGVMDKPISGVTPARNILLKNSGASCIQGHQHILDVHTMNLINGLRVWGIVAGCFLDLDQ